MDENFLRNVQGKTVKINTLDMAIYPASKKLFIDSDFYIINKSRGSGEQDLAELVKSEYAEGCWLFSPDKNNWIHIPGKRTFKRDNGKIISSSIETFVLTGAEDILGREATHYHIHPAIVGRNMVKHTKEQLAREIPLKEKLSHPKKYLNILHNIQKAVILPTKIDIRSLLRFKMNTRHEYHANFKIMSEYGLTTIEFSEQDYDIELLVSYYTHFRTNSLSRNRLRNCEDLAERINEQSLRLFSLRFSAY
jgi:hypothetical protein